MEHDMKISPSIVRRQRADRGWSQEQLATASGLSLRTVQRIEAQGIASMSSVISLAATFGIPVVDLQERHSVSRGHAAAPRYHALVLGLAVVTLAGLSEAGRLPGLPQSDVLAVMNVLCAMIGALLAAPTLVHLFKQHHYVAASLAVLGAPLVTLMAGGTLYAFVSGRLPNWQLVAMGVAGIALTVMAWRALKRAGGAEVLGT
jgi:transcriptional regulator with XRE-family HTH domain